jgi:peptide-methionine (R)-S-oxide reductase
MAARAAPPAALARTAPPAAPRARAAPAARCAARPARASADADADAQPPASATPRRAALQALLAGLAAAAAPALAARAAEDAREGAIRHTDAEWRALLPANAYGVLRRAGTELPLSSPLLNEHRAGTFACAGCAAPLFAAAAKYESGTGWPSFTAALPDAVDLTPDTSIPFMARVEVRCRRCQGHLGHVFPDGPPPTGERFCMNGAALAFEPLEG